MWQITNHFSFLKDNSDAQYSSFRDNIPYLLLLLILHPLLRRLYNSLSPVDARSVAQGAKPTIAAAGDARLKQRITFDYYFALIFITALHGISAAKVLFILYLNYNIATKLPRKYIPAVTWVFNVGTLFANELCGGYPLANVAKAVSGDSTALVRWAEWLDGLGGLMPRWEILFNITVLRLISFNMDYYWSLDYPSSSPIEVCPHHSVISVLSLTPIRRSNLIPRPCLSVTVSPSPLNRQPLAPGTTSPIFSTPLFISPGLSSHSTTTFLSRDIPQPQSRGPGLSSTASVSS